MSGLSPASTPANFWIAILGGGRSHPRALIERFILRRLNGQPLAQVLVTLGIAFIIADTCVWIWTGDPRPVPMPRELAGAFRVSNLAFPIYRLFVIGVAFALAAALWFLLERSRLGAMIRAGVDDLPMARAMGIRTSLLFSAVFCLGAALAGAGGVLAGRSCRCTPGLDSDMLPLALVVVILGGVGSLVGAFVGSFIIGFHLQLRQALFPDLAYVILFLPMVLVLMFRPHGLFGRQAI